MGGVFSLCCKKNKLLQKIHLTLSLKELILSLPNLESPRNLTRSKFSWRKAFDLADFFAGHASVAAGSFTAILHFDLISAAAPPSGGYHNQLPSADAWQ